MKSTLPTPQEQKVTKDLQKEKLMWRIAITWFLFNLLAYLFFGLIGTVFTNSISLGYLAWRYL